MDLIKITLFLACVALSQCDDKAEIEYLGDDKDFEATTATPQSPSRRFFSLQSPKEQCFCLPPAPIYSSKVTDLLRPTPGSEESRLVVYIFKNSESGQYKIYIPNIGKQRLFPNIAYDVNEVFRPVECKFTFDKLFNNVNSFVTVKKRFAQPTPTTQKPKPAPEETGGLDNAIIMDLINQSNQDKMNGLLGYLNKFKDTKMILGTLTGVTLKDKLLHLKRLYPNIYTKFETKITKFYPIWLNKGTTVYYKPGQLQTFPYDIKLISILNGKRVVINGELQLNREVKEIIVYTPQNIITNEIYPEIDINSNISFDEWLKIMSKGLQKQFEFTSKVIDVAALKSFILNVLQKNSLSLTVEGHVINSFGKKINLSHIVLRPILVGESSLINGVINNGLYRIPSGIVFLEALFKSESTITSLGIVPITNILVIYQQDTISQIKTVQIIESTKICENGVCKTKKVCRNVQGQEEPCKDFSKLRSGSADGSEERSGCKGAYCNDKKPKSQSEKQIEPSKGEDMKIVKIVDSSIAKPYIIMDKSGNLISTAVEAEKSGTPEYDTMYPDNRPIDEEPGIRIIGGNAATNSGTPVNIKGRSGE